MCCVVKVGEVHIPGDEGASICGMPGGRTSSVALPTCPLCLAWVGPTGETSEAGARRTPAAVPRGVSPAPRGYGLGRMSTLKSR
jgi:hypothetical protein